MITSILSIGTLIGLAVAQGSKKKKYESQKAEKENETRKNLELEAKLSYLNGLEEISKENNVKETFTKEETFNNGYDNLTYNDSILINFEYQRFRLITIYLTFTLFMIYTLIGNTKERNTIPYIFLICCIFFSLFMVFNLYTIYISYRAPNQYLSGVPFFLLLLSIILSAQILYDKLKKN